MNFSLNKGNPEFSPIDVMGCFANPNEISRVTTKWGVRTTYMGSQVYIFFCSSLIQVKLIYKLNSNEFFTQ